MVNEVRGVEFDQVVWLLDQRFDFLLPWFEKEYNISRKDILFVGSYHGNTRKELRKVTVGDSPDGHVSYLEPEDINKRYADKITADERTLAVPFSGAYLPSIENVTSFIATGNIASDINNKWWQYEFFREIGVKTPRTWRVKDHSELLDLTKKHFDQYESLLIKKAELAGGYKMKTVSSVEDVHAYCRMQKEDFLNSEFLVSEYIPHEQSFSGMGVISRDGKVIWCGSTEQVLYKDFAYEGLIWPPYIDKKGLDDIKDITLKVGKGLSEYGYFGYFNVDFIQGAGKMYAVEINARFCFSTIFYACCCGEKFWKAVQGEEIIESQVEGRLILGKIKAREGRGYSKLTDESNILEWFHRGTGGFQTYFVGTDELECYDYGSFIGLFGEFLPEKTDREDALKLFWDRCLQQYKEKVLRCMYVDDFCGIKEESFNFSIERRYMIKKGEISRKSDEEIKGFPKDFWGDNVSAVTLFIGENGAGKTTLMRLLIKWLCQLSAGHFPQEKGAFVISVNGKDKLIAFDAEKHWPVDTNKNTKIECMQDINEIQKMLGDVRLAYYTDTMTDLELGDMLEPEELDFLRDDSLITRLSNSIKSRYAVKSIKNCIKREDFERQMKLFLDRKEKRDNLPEFPIRYMKFTAIKAGDKESFKEVLDGNVNLIKEAAALWDNVFAADLNQNTPDIARTLLWALFSGTIISLLQWERTLPNLEKRIVTKSVRESLRAYIRAGNGDWKDVFGHFFTNMFCDCEKEFRNIHRIEEFCIMWDSTVDKITNFLDTLKKLEDGEFLKKWTPFENTQNAWEFRLEDFNEKDKNKDGNKHTTLIQDWKDLWGHYLAVADLMPECRFDWKYASSGQKNQSNLYINLLNIVNAYKDTKTNELWVLLDEPDNAFHPDWKRRIIQDLLEICSNCQINFQLLISTHSPIMLSDVPKQAAIFLKTVGEKEDDKTIEKKKQIDPEYNSFGQQIYTLFNDAFFMEQGIIGAFADTKIGEVYKQLYEIEKGLSERKNPEKSILEGYECDLRKCKCIIQLIDEPLLKGHLSQSYNLCNQRINKLQYHNLRKEGSVNDQNETV